jgi:hypothetical protein
VTEEQRKKKLDALIAKRASGKLPTPQKSAWRHDIERQRKKNAKSAKK